MKAFVLKIILLVSGLFISVSVIAQVATSIGFSQGDDCETQIESRLNKTPLDQWSEEDLAMAGQCYFRQENYNASSQVYSLLVSRDSNNLKYRQYYAESLFAQGRYEQAQEEYTAYSEYLPENKYVQLKIQSCDSLQIWELREDVIVQLLSERDSLNRNKSQTIADANLLSLPGIQDTSNINDRLNIRKNKPWLFTDFWCSSMSYSSEGNVLAYSLRKINRNRNGKYYGKSEIMIDSPTNTSPDSLIRFQPTGVTEDADMAHPAFACEGKRLYFAADLPGGFGGTDIWYSDLTNGIWAEPVNLGETINTSFDELSPALKGDTLFFASEGFPGYGALDLFFSRKSERGFSVPINLKAPHNTRNNELLYKPYGESFALFSSDRNNNQGDALLDVYSVVTIQSKIQKDTVLTEPYVFKAEKMKMPWVFFEFDKAEILPEFKRELEQLADTLKKYEYLQLEIVAYTDAYGSANNNLELSQRRADSVQTFFIDLGVNDSQLITKGQGIVKDTRLPVLTYHVFTGTSVKGNRNTWYERQTGNRYAVKTFRNGSFFSYYVGSFNTYEQAQTLCDKLNKQYHAEYIVGASYRGVFLPNFEYAQNRRAELHLKDN